VITLWQATPRSSEMTSQEELYRLTNFNFTCGVDACDKQTASAEVIARTEYTEK